MNEYLTRVELVRATIADITQSLSQTKISVRQRGMSASVDYNKAGKPVAVNLPYLPDNASDELIDAVQGFLDHEVGHVLFTDSSALLPIAHDNELSLLSNVIEDPFVEAKMRTRFAGSKHNFNRLFHFFLDKVVEPAYQKAKADPASSPMKMFSALMPAIARAWYNVDVFNDYMKDKWADVKPIIDKINTVDATLITEFGKTKSTSENVDVARRLLYAIYWVEPKSLESDKEEEEEEEKEKSETHKFSTGAAGGYGESGGSGGSASEIDEESIEDDLDESESEEGESEEETEDESKEGETEDESKEGESEDESEEGESEDESEEGESEDESEEETEDESEEEASPTISFGEDSEEEDESLIGESELSLKGEEVEEDESVERLSLEGLSTIDESISKEITHEMTSALSASSYTIPTTEFDVIEVPAIHDRDAARRVIDSLSKTVEEYVGQMSFELERTFLSMNKSFFRPGQYSGSLNANALSRLHVGDPRVFRRKVNQKTKEYDVSLVIDLSGSMNSSAGPSMTRMSLAIMTANALAQVLDKLDVNFEIIGFSTGKTISFTGMEEMIKKVNISRSESLYMPIFKAFNEQWTIETQERLALPLINSNVMRNNVDGECVAIAASRLMNQPSTGKAMIVLSDGIPMAMSDDSRSLQKHLKDTCTRIERSGVKLIGIGLNTDAVKRFYTNNIVVNNPSDLPSTMISQIKEIILESGE